MLIIENKMAVIGHPKTGVTSIRKALRDNFLILETEGPHGVNESYCKQLRDEGGLVIGTVRNPWDLMVSWWYYSIVRPSESGSAQYWSFEEWLPWVLVAGNGWIEKEKGLFYGEEECTHFIYFERDIEVQLNWMLTECGLGPVEVGHHNSTNHKPYQEHYNPFLVDLVYERFEEEIWAFGYDYLGC
jgi:hypothetical protein